MKNFATQSRNLLFCIFCLLSFQGQEATAQANPDGGLQFISSYLQPTVTVPSPYLVPELNGEWFTKAMGAVHMSPWYFNQNVSKLRRTKAIIDIGVALFPNANLGPNAEADLIALGQAGLFANQSKILAFYVMDEPTSRGITRTTLERAIALLNKHFPKIPTYIVYAQNCFDPDINVQRKCSADGVNLNPEPTIPSNVDWVGFDWYLNGDPRLGKDGTEFQSKIINTVVRLKTLTKKPIVLVPDGTDQHLKYLPVAERDYYADDRLKRFLNYAKTEPRIIGVDVYAWAEHKETLNGVPTDIYGVRSWPALRTSLLAASDYFLSKTYVGTQIVIPHPSFGGQFAISARGKYTYYYKSAGAYFYCSYKDEQEYLKYKPILGLSNVITPVYTNVEWLYYNGHCIP